MLGSSLGDLLILFLKVLDSFLCVKWGWIFDFISGTRGPQVEIWDFNRPIPLLGSVRFEFKLHQPLPVSDSFVKRNSATTHGIKT